MRFGWNSFSLTLGCQHPDKKAMRLLNSFIYTALAESKDSLSNRPFVVLLTIRMDGSEFAVEMLTHARPFFERFEQIVQLFVTGENAAVAERVDVASKIVRSTKISYVPGRFVPYEVSLQEGTLCLQPRPYAISFPRCSTSELLVALSALINGCVLAVEHNGPMEVRDILLVEYLENAKSPADVSVSFDDFRCHDDDYEFWYFATKEERRPEADSANEHNDAQ